MGRIVSERRGKDGKGLIFRKARLSSIKKAATHAGRPEGKSSDKMIDIPADIPYTNN